MEERLTRAGVCFFRSGGRELAVGLDAVDEVADVVTLVPIPLTSPTVLGLHIHRRTVIPVVQPPGCVVADNAEASPILLVLRSEQGPWGLMVDRAGLAIVDKPMPIVPIASLGVGAGGDLAIEGGVDFHGRLHRLIDAGRTWQMFREQIEGWYSTHTRRGAAVSLASVHDTRELIQGSMLPC